MAKNNKNTFNNEKKVVFKAKPSFVSAPPAKEVKKRESTPISNKELLITTIISLVLFVALAAYELIVNNSDTLFMAQGRNLVNNGSELFSELSKAPGSLAAWLGCYFTQFFYYPALGSSILIAFWCLLFFLIKKAYRLSNLWSVVIIIPLALLLISIIHNGYWIYYLKQPGYWFRETFGFIYTASSVWAVSRLSKSTRSYISKSVASIILISVGYYYFGYYALLAGVCILANEWCNTKKENITGTVILSAAVAITILFIPHILYTNIFTEIRSDKIFIAGLPLFQQDGFTDTLHSYPFIATSLILVALPFLNFVKEESLLKYRLLCRFAILAILAGIAYFVDSKDFKDYNYHAELRMYDAVENQRWDEVLYESANYTQHSFEERKSGKKDSHPTREMVIFTHIALMNEGKMGDQMFKFNNFGSSPYVSDTLYDYRTKLGADGKTARVLDDNKNEILDTLCLRVHMVQTAGSLIYYNHAKTNFASRWCIENSVEFGYTFNDTKILVRCALVNGEWEVAKKYLDILKKSIYYKDWAEKYEPIIKNPKLITKYQEFQNILELYNHMGTTLDGDQGLCEMYLLNYFGNTMNKDSKLLQELTLNYAMINKDIQLFWPRFFLYAQLHKGEDMPIHYQEAAYLYGNLEKTVDISAMPFSDQVKQRYASFQQVSQSYLQQGMSQDDVRDLMEPMFGDTFYWFYFFCRNVKSY